LPLVTALIASTIVSTAACSWDQPGANRYIGNVADAVYNYTDIPKPVQDALHARMLKHDYDDLAEITADSINGAFAYDNLRDMHFGRNQICGNVSRAKWGGKAERGLVYCEAEHCIIVPTVCGNVSRVTKVLYVPEHIDKLERNFKSEEEERQRKLLEEEEKRLRWHKVPEPSTLGLVFAALLSFCLSKRRR
jgi:hypothetical protein